MDRLILLEDVQQKVMEMRLEIDAYRNRMNPDYFQSSNPDYWGGNSSCPTREQIISQACDVVAEWDKIRAQLISSNLERRSC